MAVSSSFRPRDLSRRTFLRGAGVAIALPWLDVMSRSATADTDRSVPRRMVAIETNQGIMPQFFFPKNDGVDYELTPYRERIAAHRRNMTVFSGVSLPGVDGAHAAEKCFPPDCIDRYDSLHIKRACIA